MDIFEHFFENEKLKDVLLYIDENYDLVPKIAWNQPMFTDHETFIIGFSTAKNHISVAVEPKTISHFSKNILDSGYEHTSNLFKIKTSDVIDFSLLDKMIMFNIEDKKQCTTFFRK